MIIISDWASSTTISPRDGCNTMSSPTSTISNTWKSHQTGEDHSKNITISTKYDNNFDNYQYIIMSGSQSLLESSLMSMIQIKDIKTTRHFFYPLHKICTGWRPWVACCPLCPPWPACRSPLSDNDDNNENNDDVGVIKMTIMMVMIPTMQAANNQIKKISDLPDLQELVSPKTMAISYC